VNAKTLNKMKNQLKSDHEHLVTELCELESAGHDNLSETSGENNYRDHMADQGTATFARELDMGILENTRHLLDQVDEALERIETGEYGVCTRCGNHIPIPRLEASPAAALCIGCKEWEEGS